MPSGLCQLSYPGIELNAFYIKLLQLLSIGRQLTRHPSSCFLFGWLIPNAFGTLPAELPGNRIECFLYQIITAFVNRQAINQASVILFFVWVVNPECLRDSAS
jgi:hypothetical protein